MSFLFERGDERDIFKMSDEESPPQPLQDMLNTTMTEEQREQLRDHWKRRRAAAKQKLSKKLARVEPYMKRKELTQAEIVETKTNFEEAKLILKELQDCQSQVLAYGSVDDPERDPEISNLDKNEDLFEDMRQQFLKISVKEPTIPAPLRDDRRDPTAMEEMRWSAASLTYDATKDIQPFDGNDISKFPVFDIQWQAVDVKLSKMKKTDGEKLIQLKRCLKDRALKCISQVTVDDYEGALKLLRNFFNDGQQTGRDAVKRLLNLPKMESTVRGMEDFLLEIMQIHQTFAGLKLNTDQTKTLLFTGLVEEKLNSYVHKAWAQRTNEMRDSSHPLKTTATENDLFEVIQEEIKITRSLSTKQRKDSKTEEKSKDDKKRKEQGSKGSLPGNFATRSADKGGNKTDDPTNCTICDQRHFPRKCPVFKQKTLEERWQVVRDRKLCHKCFEKHHTSKCNKLDCDRGNCGKPHARLLHPTKTAAASTNATQQVETPMVSATSEVFTSCGAKDSKQVRAILGALTAWAVAPSGEKFKATVFLDSGSEITLITRGMSNRMGLGGAHQTLQMSVASGIETQATQEKLVDFHLESLDGTYRTPKISAITTKTITAPLRSVPFNPAKYPHLRNVTFTEDYPRHETKEVEIMLGLPYCTIIECGEKIKGKGLFEPIAVPTKLGNVLTGSYEEQGQTTHSGVYVSMKCSLKEVDDTLQQFFNLESLGIKPMTEKQEQMTLDEEAAVDLMEKSACYEHTTKTWRISLPFKEDPSRIPDNYAAARAVLFKGEDQAIERGQVEELNKTYQELVDGGFVERVPDSDLDLPQGKLHYLQCHPIFKDHSTTKVRIVTNASAKRRGKCSLNDLLYQGPCLLPDFVKVLIRFRLQVIAFVLDISKMFLRIKIKDHKDYLRFLWRNCQKHVDPEVWRYNSLAFGLNCAPFCAIFVLMKHAELFSKTFPLAERVIKHDTYMDDSTSGAKTVGEAKELLNQLYRLLMEASMTPHKFSSNNKDALSDIPIDLQSKANVIKVLGVYWDTSADTLVTNFIEKLREGTATKRTLLQQSASVFDPLGLIAPFTIRVKILFQSLWLSQVGWDENLPPDIQESWDSWRNEASDFIDFKRPRFFFDPAKGMPDQVDLFAFGDSSERAFGTAVYVAGTYHDGTVCSELVLSKTRVAPIAMLTSKKPTESIVRLELLACLCTARALSYVTEALSGVTTVRTSHCFTDSLINLQRIRRGPDKFKVWVASRLKEILTLTDRQQWNFCPGVENPADLPSRGLTAVELKSSDLWWKGPKFITMPISDWPKEPGVPSGDPEIKANENVEHVMALHLAVEDFDKIFDRFSSWTKTVRLFAFILRLGCPTHRQFRGQPLTLKERTLTEEFLFRFSQKRHFEKEYQTLQKGSSVDKSSKLIAFNPVWDAERQLLLSHSRLSHSELPNETKFPVILPKHCELVQKFVLHLHEQHGHAGPDFILSLLRQRFQLCQARRQVRSVLHRCTKRFCTRPKLLGQQMAPLPSLRTDNPGVFRRVAVDLFGPMFVRHSCDLKDCPHPPASKVYGALFTCFHTRAIHLELLKDQGTEEFINGLLMFVGRRGQPETLFSDCAKNFKAASKELRALFRSINWNRIQRDPRLQNIEWIFNVERAPWGNAICERMVRSVKTPLRLIVGTAKLTFRQLSVILTEVEALVNARPLGTVSDHPDDLTPITPFELVNGRRMDQLPDPNQRNQPQTNLQHLWRKRQQVLNAFWRRWKKDYLLTQGVRKKWQVPSQQDLLNRLVLIHEDNVARNHWVLGRIIETIPSKDGLIRTAIIKTATSTLRRPIQRLALLESVF